MKPESRGIVYVVDDDASVCRALTRLIRSAGYQVESFNSASAFLEHRQQSMKGPACLVLDIRLPPPGIDGMALQRELRRRGAGAGGAGGAGKDAGAGARDEGGGGLPIIFITGHGDVPTSVRAMKDGALDFLTKPVQEGDLLRAIEAALDRAARDLADAAELAALRSRYDTLTMREREVMALVVVGLLNKQVADELGTVEKTIKVHRGRVMEKMQADSLAELVRIALRLGIGGEAPTAHYQSQPAEPKVRAP